MYRLNAKFALGQNVTDSFTNRIVGFIRGETRAQGRFTHLCRETLVIKQLLSCFSAASSASLAYYQTHFFLFIYFYIAIAHSSIIKPVLNIYSDTGSETSTRIRTPPSYKPSNTKCIYRNLHT